MMEKSLGGFRAALLIGWMALSAAGWLYARDKGVPTWAAVPVLAAFLLEYSFYLVPGFEAAREWLATAVPERQLPFVMSASGAAPYLVYSLGTGQFEWGALVRLLALALAISLWYLVLPRSNLTDLAFLTLVAAVLLRKYFDPVYNDFAGVRDIDILGHLMLIRLAAIAILIQRRAHWTGFGFLPNAQEWSVGLRHFLYFLPVGFPLALWLRLIRFDVAGFAVWKVAAMFAGILWVVALSEEFFFRGLLQQWLTSWTHRPQIALALTSVLFGLCHLPFRAFPNWKFAAVAALAGWFYGRAYREAHSIRASMVTHALVVTTWRAVFS